MNASNLRLAALACIFLGPMISSAQYTKEADETQKRLEESKQRENEIRADEEKSKISSGYLRILNFTESSAGPIAVALRTNEGDPQIISRSLKPGRILDYRRFPVGKWELAVARPIFVDLEKPDLALIPPPWESLKRISCNIDKIDLERDGCLTLILSGSADNLTGEIVKDDETPPPALRVIQSVPGEVVDVGVTENEQDRWLWEKIGKGIYFAPPEARSGRLQMVVALKNRSGRIGKRWLELDWAYTNRHSVVIHRDAYGRITCTPLEDGLRAALAAQ